MNLFNEIRAFLSFKETRSLVRIALPTTVLGTWIGYFVSTPIWPFWFYVVWPFGALTVILALLFCFYLIINRRTK